MFGLNNLWIEIPLFFWVMFQIPATIVIVVQCVSNLEYYEDKRVLLFWPLLVWSLRETLTVPGVVLATIFISILFLPAIVAYFAAASIGGLIYIVCTSFVKLFRRED